MNWNYRVVLDKEGALSIREVYYNDDGTPYAYSSGPSTPYGESDDEISADLVYMLTATTKTTLIQEEMDQIINDNSHIQEAVDLLNNKTSCGGKPDGWIPEEEFKKDE